MLSTEDIFMQIACLSWGSLVWNLGDLPVRGPWFPDGPLLPIEFARMSQHGRITLVIIDEPEFPHIRSFWTLLSVESLDAAKLALARREGITRRNIPRLIGAWTRGTALPGNPIS